ncbi:hypothetical protein [Citricoccus sp. I39-566]|uniref:hypothetical protein n=1 Tax=Citricoccus sp. I39-566 TaxID=3073268 RepID=UPI00286AE387|nr:hypothetical protein [Citricoccus sp. I39-566]WMY78636.1 hypothetical protein RE421_01865 [Citricoccus sp. I39-566]
MALPGGWIEHRREDGEPIGWIVPDGGRFRPVDILGRPVGGPVDWFEAEEALEERGLAFLAERHVLRLPDGSERPVRISQASPEGIVVVADEYGAASAVGAGAQTFRLTFPAPAELLLHGR